MPQTAQSRETLQHYVDQGLLQARSYAQAAPGIWGMEPGLQIYARVPQASDPMRWVFGNNEQNVLYPYELPPEVFDHPDAQLIFTLQIGTSQPRPLTQKEIENELHDATATTRPTTQGVKKFPPKPYISTTMLNENGYTVLSASEMMDAAASFGGRHQGRSRRVQERQFGAAGAFGQSGREPGDYRGAVEVRAGEAQDDPALGGRKAACVPDDHGDDAGDAIRIRRRRGGTERPVDGCIGQADEPSDRADEREGEGDAGDLPGADDFNAVPAVARGPEARGGAGGGVRVSG